MLNRKPVRRLASIAWIAACGALLALAACSRPSATSEVAFSPCRLKGIEIALKCADLDMPEDRDHAADAGSRRIAIHVAVIPALARKPEPDPVFVFAGGPGQSATDIAGLVFPLFSKLNRDRDIVLVDQRGTGKSNALTCSEETAAENLSDAFDPKDIDAQIAHCAARLSAKADLTRYTTPIAMRDVDEVRARLGYRQIDLWGASYGTRAALEYARQFPQNVRTMTLDGVAPAWQKLPLSFGVDTHATLVALVGDCSRDAACARHFPHLAADLEGLFDRLEARPIDADIVHPVTGRRQHVAVTGTGLAQLLRTPLYTSLTASLMPSAIRQAAQGDFDPLGALTLTVGSGLEEHLALGMHLSVVCAEDVPAMTDVELAAARTEAAKSVVDGRPNRFALVFVEQYRRLCAHWPSRPVDAAYFDTLAGKPGANIPTLLLSGGLDPATPPAHAASVASALTNVRHLVAPGIGHGVSLQGCAPDLIERFVKTADPQAIDGQCLAAIPRPPFFAPIVDGRRDQPGEDDRGTVP